MTVGETEAQLKCFSQIRDGLMCGNTQGQKSHSGFQASGKRLVDPFLQTTQHVAPESLLWTRFLARIKMSLPCSWGAREAIDHQDFPSGSRRLLGGLGRAASREPHFSGGCGACCKWHGGARRSGVQAFSGRHAASSSQVPHPDPSTAIVGVHSQLGDRALACLQIPSILSLQNTVVCVALACPGPRLHCACGLCAARCVSGKRLLP